jgi:hypothetical protein
VTGHITPHLNELKTPVTLFVRRFEARLEWIGRFRRPCVALRLQQIGINLCDSCNRRPGIPTINVCLDGRDGLHQTEAHHPCQRRSPQYICRGKSIAK